MIQLKLALCIVFSIIPPMSFAKSSCGEGQHWVEPHFRRGYVRHDGVRVKSTQVSGHCRKNPRGYDQWHRSLSNKRPKIWRYKENSKKWSIEEVHRLYDALSVLPDEMLELGKIKLYRMQKSIFKENPATTNLNDVTLYDLAFRYKKSLAQVLSHEFSHILFNKLTSVEREEFARSSQWEVIIMGQDTLYVPSKNKKMVRGDSMTSLEEDYSNHVEEYLFNLDRLKKVSPKATIWIRKKYGSGFKIERGKQ